MDPFKRKLVDDYDYKHFDPRKTGRDQFNPNINYGPNYKPTPGAALDATKDAIRKEKKRLEENRKKKTFKLP